MAGREFDIVIFGATGFTGRYVVEELSKSVDAENLKWAIAGRSTEKLRDALEIVQKYLGDAYDIRMTPVIKADVNDPESISMMCKRTKLVLNCAGPYNIYGDLVVSSCIDNGTHHLDLSVEIKYLESIQARYFHAANENCVYVVEACGIGSIPVDYGISLLKSYFSGDINAVEYFMEFQFGPSGRKVNTGTLLSIVHSVNDFLLVKQYNDMLQNVFTKSLKWGKYRIYRKFWPIFFSPKVKSWCLSAKSPDERIIVRSQKFRLEYLNERPIQSYGYVQVPSFFEGLFMIFIFGVCVFLSFFRLGRNLLETYPSLFTAGIFSPEGPTRQQVLEGASKITLFANGWKDKLPEPFDQHARAPDKEIKLTISGPEPAYAFTSKCMVEAGLVILQETDKLPLNGGVLTPGVAFEKTSLKERLEKRGISFTFQECN